jgi:hypothetical protein
MTTTMSDQRPERFNAGLVAAIVWCVAFWALIALTLRVL